MPTATNLLTASILAPVITILSAVSLATLQRGLEWITFVAKTPQKGYLKELRPYAKQLDLVFERNKFSVNTTNILLMAIVILILCLLLDNSEKPKMVMVNPKTTKKE